MFREAFKNTMTPLHLAVVLGNDEVVHFLLSHQANVNLQTKIRGYTCLHLAVLANKPEMIIELLTKSEADPMMTDNNGRTLLDLV